MRQRFNHAPVLALIEKKAGFLAMNYVCFKSQAAFQEDWPADVPTSVICLPLNVVEGFELRDP